MIAIDSSSWIAFFSDTEPSGDDTALVESALADHQACLPPVVLTELLSDPKLPKSLASMFCELPLLEPHAGYWDRAGRLRAKLIAQRRRARLADSLIAHGSSLAMTISCISLGLAGFGSQSRPKEGSSAFRIRTGIPFEVRDLSYSLLANRSQLPLPLACS